MSWTGDKLEVDVLGVPFEELRVNRPRVISDEYILERVVGVSEKLSLGESGSICGEIPVESTGVLNELAVVSVETF